MTNLFEQVKQHKEQDLPFVIYSKPNSNKTIGFFQSTDDLYLLSDFTQEGFVFAPFESGSPCVFLRENVQIIEEVNIYSETNFESGLNSSLEDTSEKLNFENLVLKAINIIKLGSCQKIVVSRKEEVIISNFDIETSFKKMLTLYPAAFKYCMYHPKIGLWIGATPEQLVKVNGNEIKTVALAGTKLKEDALEWKPKEQQEQQFVTDYILENISPFVVETSISKPYTVAAGNIQHIKTDISAKMNKVSSLKNIIDVLHPTPAVCGYPKNTALDFILENENYKRSYYTGFLGELNYSFETNKHLTSDLFVNLRCMQVKEATAEIFVGCGITMDSNPEMEYLETKNKSETMKKIL
jgi:isochorismate synthase